MPRINKPIPVTHKYRSKRAEYCNGPVIPVAWANEMVLNASAIATGQAANEWNGIGLPLIIGKTAAFLNGSPSPI